MRNVIITNISTLPKGVVKENLYQSNLGAIEGIYTNDAPVKYLISYINSLGGKTDKIIAVSTTEADTAYDKFCETMKTYVKEKNYDLPEIIKIPTSETVLAETIKEIVNEIRFHDNIYIDTTGGFRNSSYILMGVVRILEYSNIKLTKAVYSKYDRENAENNSIIDVTDTYRMFDLINAVNTFTSVGNSHELEEYFKLTEDATIQETINAMNEFSDAITLCRTSKLGETLNKLNRSLDAVAEIQSDSKDIILFRSLSETIKNKFGVKNGEIEYPDIVKWCLDNRLIQQAVTIYTEKMPEYFFQKKFFTVCDETKKRFVKQNKKSYFGLEYEMFYGGLMANMFLPNGVNTILNIIKNADLNNMDSIFKKSTDDILFKGMCECEDANTFIYRYSGKSYKKYNLRGIRSELEKYFKIRNYLYDSNGNLRSKEEYLKKLQKYPDVHNILGRNEYKLPNRVHNFPKTLCNNKPLYMAVFGISLEYEDNHLNSIELLSCTSEYTLSDKYTMEEKKEILRDIYYLKTFVRNKLNHASDDDKAEEERIKYFEKYGYNVNADYGIREISELMYEALKKMKE